MSELVVIMSVLSLLGAYLTYALLFQGDGTGAIGQAQNNATDTIAKVEN